MRPASQQFVDSLRYSHVIAASCDLLFPGNPTPVAVAVEGGSIRIDRTAEHRRAGTVEIPWSVALGAEIGVDIRTLPLGGYAIVRRGLRYASGATEQIQLGRLRVESVSWNTLEATASLELADRMAQVRGQPFTAPYAAKGKTAAQAAVGIVQAVFGATISYSTPHNPAGVFGDVFYTGERTEALSAIEQASGGETYFDALGNFVFAKAPSDAPGTPVWTVDAGALGVMVDAGESLDRTGIYNAVLVQGQPAADVPPVSALATYTDPASPIRYGGPFGQVVLVADSTEVQSAAQALTTAQALLKLRLKQNNQLELRAAPNPALEAGDTIRVLFPDGRDELHLIDAVEVPLGTETQQIITRSDQDPGEPV